MFKLINKKNSQLFALSYDVNINHKVISDFFLNYYEEVRCAYYIVVPNQRFMIEKNKNILNIKKGLIHEFDHEIWSEPLSDSLKVKTVEFLTRFTIIFKGTSEKKNKKFEKSLIIDCDNKFKILFNTL